MIVAVIGILIAPAIKAADPPGQSAPVVMIGNQVKTNFEVREVGTERGTAMMAATKYSYSGGNKIFETLRTVSAPEIVIRA